MRRFRPEFELRVDPGGVRAFDMLRLADVRGLPRLGPLLPADRLTVTLTAEAEGRRAVLQGEARLGDV